MSDIVEKLKNKGELIAAKEIERLREENEELKHPRCDGEHDAVIERLRGLLREGTALMSKRNREDWRKRVGEALGHD